MSPPTTGMPPSLGGTGKGYLGGRKGGGGKRQKREVCAKEGQEMIEQACNHPPLCWREGSFGPSSEEKCLSKK